MQLLKFNFFFFIVVTYFNILTLQTPTKNEDKKKTIRIVQNV